MHFEVVFILNGKEVARYRFSAEAPVDFQAGVGNAIETLRVDHPEQRYCHSRLLRQGSERDRLALPWLIGGAADLAPSIKTRLTFEGAGDLEAEDAPDGKPKVILIGSGSEVVLCIDAYEKLKQEGVAARVVSMPSWELFEQRDQSYRDAVLPPDVVARVSVEDGLCNRVGPLCRQ
jgi:transketolase-like protein